MILQISTSVEYFLGFEFALKGHSFAAPSSMMMKSSSFECPKPHLLAFKLKDSIEALLRYVILAQINPYGTNVLL